MIKRILSFLIAAALVLNLGCALGETTKHEKVYAAVSADGTLLFLTDIVRLENADGLEMITDRTSLKDIKSIGGDTSFTRDGETIVWQTGGRDVTYQGTVDSPLPLTPEVRILLDGEEIPAGSLADKKGHVDMTVSCLREEDGPYIALTVLLLPEKEVTGLTMENACETALSGQHLAAGLTFPGADPSLGLPVSFSLHFEADHAQIGWMMTFASADPIPKALAEAEDHLGRDPRREYEEVTALLTALQKGETLPQSSGWTGELSAGINELNSSLKLLDEGAFSLSDGAKELSEGTAAADEGAQLLLQGADSLRTGTASLQGGADELKDGLAALSAGSDTLNSGAQALFAAVLSSAGDRLSSSGLQEAGIGIVPLTAENYREVLTGAIAMTAPEAAKAAVRERVENAVRTQAEEAEKEIRAEVTRTVREKVLAAVLAESGSELDAQTYAAGVRNGAVDEAAAEAIGRAVDAQMGRPETAAAIDAAVEEQIGLIVSKNVDLALESDPAALQALSLAGEAHESLTELFDQLTRAEAFVTGLSSYTAGVDRASEGAAALSAGAAELNEGAGALYEGAAGLCAGTASLNAGALELSGGALKLAEEGTAPLRTALLETEKSAAGKLSSLLTEDAAPLMHLYEQAAGMKGNTGCDLRAEGMDAVTVWIIRTDMK